MTEVWSFPIGLLISDMRVQLMAKSHTFAFCQEHLMDLDLTEQPKLCRFQ